MQIEGRSSKLQQEAWGSHHDGDMEVIAMAMVIASIYPAVTVHQVHSKKLSGAGFEL